MNNKGQKQNLTKTCPKTNQPGFQRSEWKDIHFDKNYRTTLRLIGDNILLSNPNGYITLNGIKSAMACIEKVSKEAIPHDQPFVLIEDFSGLKGVSIPARRYYVDFLLKRRKRFAGIVFLKASETFKIIIKLGKRLSNTKYEVQLAEKYSDAVRLALDILQRQPHRLVTLDLEARLLSNPIPKRWPTHDIISNSNWTSHRDGFSTRFEVIDGNVLHSISTGFLKEAYVKEVIRIREMVKDSTAPTEGFDYMIVNVTQLRGTDRRARKLYMDSVKEWHKHYPFRAYFMYGVNRFMRAASGLASPFMPFKVKVVDDLDSALRLIAEENTAAGKTQAVRDTGGSERTALTSTQTRQHVDELLQVIGRINWETDGVGNDMEIDPLHPFAPVFEAIVLIKGELDELFKEKQNAEDALRKARDEMEMRVIERTADIEQANEELRIEIAERERAEAELHRSKEAADAANQAKSDFLANMSHELRTPLNHIIGFTELVVDGKFGVLNEAQGEYLTDVLHSSNHLLSLINDILDLSKVEAGKLELEPGEVDLRSLLENSITMVKEKAMKHGIELSLEINKIPEVLIADERKLKQIMYNLLSNAVKFTPDGGSVRLSAKRANGIRNLGIQKSINAASHDMQSEAGNSPILISIADTGIGMKPEDQDRIFKAFEQVDGSSARRFQGTGLGLSLTESLVAIHGGRIWVESEGEGKGSKFSFIIPANGPSE